MSEDLEELRAKFSKVFASVPLPLRDEIISVIDDEPVSWSAAYLEISNKTEKGDKILKFLKHIELI
jgi:hypothetical protein